MAFKKILVNISLSLLGLGIALIGIEAAFRMLSPTHKRRWSDRPKIYFMPNDAPSLQDASYQLEKPPHTFRIAIVGDSFTFGPYLQYDDTFPKRLERWLNLNKGEQTVEVHNFGTSGLSTHHEIEVVKRALRYKPDLILLQITLNDGEEHSLTKEARDSIFGPPEFLKSKLFDYWQSARYALTRIHNTRTYRLYLDYFHTLFSDPKSYGRFDSALGRMKDLCDSKQTAFSAVLFPMFSFPLDKHYPFLDIHHTIHNALRSHAIPHLDLLHVFRDIPHERLEIIPGVDSHPNEIAHRVAAETILRWFAEHDSVPESALPQNLFRKRKDLRSRRAPGALKRGQQQPDAEH